MTFTKEFLQNDLYNSANTVLDEITSHGRWSVSHRRIFRHEGRFYETRYSAGATETQDEAPYDYADDNIECPEVVPVEKLITVYDPVKPREQE